MTTPAVSQFVKHGDTLYGVGMDNAVWETKIQSQGGASSWKRITEGSVKMIQYHNGILYGLGMEGDIWKWIHGKWSKINGGGTVTKFLISGNDIYGIGTDKAVWKSNIHGATWSRITSGSITDLAVWNGHFYGVGTENDIWRHPIHGGNSWQKMTPPCVSKLFVQDNFIFGIGTNHGQIHGFPINSSGPWKEITKNITGGKMSEFLMDASGQIYAIGSDKAIYRTSGNHRGHHGGHHEGS